MAVHRVLPPQAPPGRTLHRVVLAADRDVEDTAVYQEDLLPDGSYQHDGTTAWAWYPNEPFGTDVNLGLGANGNLGWPCLRFDLADAIPDGAQVVQAVLSMYAEDGWYGYQQHGSSHKMLSAWDEDTLTFNNMPPDWDNGIYESTVYINAYNRWWDWDITQMTTDWVADPASNFGVSIIPTDTLYDGDWILWCSDDHDSVSLRPKLTVDFLLPEHRAAFVSQQAPASTLTIGERTGVVVRFRNDGADDWTTAAGYRLGSQSPADNTNWGTDRVALPAEVAMGQQVEFSFEVTAPASPGSYMFQWQMFHEGIGWFGDTSDAVEVTVSRKPNGQSCSQATECDSGNCVDGVCCDSICAGDCMHCALPGLEGNCRYVPAGDDPDGECAGDPPCGAHCDGSGGCAYPPAGTDCAACASCDGSGQCNQFEPAGTDPDDICGVCAVCPGDGPGCAPVAAGSDPFEECGEQPPESCGLTGGCDGAGACAFHQATTECDPARCENDVHHPADLCDGAGSCIDSGEQPCLPYVCLDAVSCRTDCVDDSHCTGESHCEAGQCVAYLHRGDPCTSDPQCITGHCVDGVCCDTVCGGVCQACNLPADPGGCLPVPDGQDPRDDCAGTGTCGGVCDGQEACRFTPDTVQCAPCTTCNGAGACNMYAPAGTDPFDDCAACRVCSGVDTSCQLVAEGDDPVEDCPDLPAESCATTGACNGEGACALWQEGTVCNPASCTAGLLQPADLCDGTGVCQDAGEVDCDGYHCLADDACRQDCTEDAHCLPGHHCAGGSCEANLNNGQACTRDEACISGYCTDGVCCDSRCDGTCQRCDLAQTVGACGNVPDGQDPDAECPGEAPCGGTCDGQGSCRFPGEETSCAACAHCDGLGNCALFVAAGTDPDDTCGLCRVCPGDGPDCVPVPAGQDTLDECDELPQESCATDGSCDGDGACRLWAAATPCGQQRCLGDTLTRAPTCDGAGNCVEQGSVSCAPFLCDGDQCAGPEDLHHVTVEDAPGGTGQRVESQTLSTDDSLVLYAIGRDEDGNFLADVLVTWQVSSDIGKVAPGPSRSATFDPTRPGTGQVLADYYLSQVADGATGSLTVQAGVAAGTVALSPEPQQIPADGTSTSVISAGPVTDADGNVVHDGTSFTLVTSAGSLRGEDDDPGAPGFQRLTHDGMFSFVVVSDPAPARALVRAAAAPPGTAQGETIVYFGDGRPVADAGPDRTVPGSVQVVLDASASFDPFDRPLVYNWSQIDGPEVALEDADSAAPSFVAPPAADEPFVLVFELTVRVAADTSDPDTVEVTVEARDTSLPVARMELTPASGPAPLEVSLNGSGSTAAADAELVDYLWTFSDGATALRGVTARSTFDQPGGYGVRLLVVDDAGRFAAADGMVAVLDDENHPPLLALSAVPERGEAPLEVQFEATASDPDGNVASIRWDFGAGFTLTGERQTKIYAAPGTYLVRVQATDDQGLITTVELAVFVSEEGAYLPHILTTPPTTARVGQDYTYQAAAVGTPDLTWSLGKTIDGETAGAPDGMQLNPDTGLVNWRPGRSQAGPTPVTLVVHNAAGTDFQDFVVEVVPDESAGNGCSCGNSSSPTPWLLVGLAMWLALTRRRRKSTGAA